MKPKMSLIAAAAAGVLAAPALTAASPPPAKSFGFDARFIDRSADPCRNFFQYACGNWLKENPIPAEYPSWGRFNELGERNQAELRKILEAAASSKGTRDPLTQKIGDYYASCMDEAYAEKAGAKPLEEALARIDKVKDAKDVLLESGRLRLEGVAALFTFDSGQDARDTKEIIAEVSQGGLGLPDRDYYTKTDEKSVKLREQYVAHVVATFKLLGDPDPQAAARAVMAVESALAKGSLTRVERRDPERLYNRLPVVNLEALLPGIAWKAYFTEMGFPELKSVNLSTPGYFKALESALGSIDLPSWKTYLRWSLVRSQAPRLSAAFVNENFAFFGKALTGAKELRPRWKRCVAATDQDLRDLLGKPYVDKTFGADGKKRMEELVAALLDAMGEDLDKIAWMDDETRKRAKEKLSTFESRIGYPEKWRDMSKLEVSRGSWATNAANAARFGLDYELRKIGKPLDRTEWGMTPPTVNASYNPQKNQITFPAGILQPPFFDRSLDDAVNFGAIGGVIGHEISHGFDDQGSQFDKDGNLKNWWTEKAAAEFKRRAACVEKQFANYTAVDDIKVNGKLTLGENIGDLGGLRISYAALKKVRAGKPDPKIDGLSEDQRFFLGWGQVWCRSGTPEDRRMRAATDPHAPGEHRVNGPLSNLPEFQKAFSCPDDTPMVRKAVEICEIW